MPNAEELSSAIGHHIRNAADFSGLSADETVTLEIGYVKSSRTGREGVTVSFHFGPTSLTETIAQTVDERLDKRKFRIGDRQSPSESWDIGTVTVDGDGNVVDYAIDSDYLKPTERK